MTDTMQRWTMAALGREHLQLTESAIPQPGPHEIRVKVKAVALNYRDKLVIETGMGMTLPQPFTPASDMAGEVDAIGAGVSRPSPGDRVISCPSTQTGSMVPENRTVTRVRCPTAPLAVSIRYAGGIRGSARTTAAAAPARWTTYRPAPCPAPA